MANFFLHLHLNYSGISQKLLHGLCVCIGSPARKSASPTISFSIPNLTRGGAEHLRGKKTSFRC